MTKKTPLTPKHRMDRLRRARDYLTQKRSLTKDVIWSDEKRFALDSPDSYQHYWADLRADAPIMSRRQNGGGGVTVWGFFSARGKFNIMVVKGNLNAEKYIGLIDACQKPYIERYHPAGAVLQQDNASAHAAHSTRMYLFDNDIDVMDWPSRSPDLNPVENAWVQLARIVYGKCTQYDSKEQLCAAIKEAAKQLDVDCLSTLVRSVKKRAMKLLERGGRHTSTTDA